MGLKWSGGRTNAPAFWGNRTGLEHDVSKSAPALMVRLELVHCDEDVPVWYAAWIPEDENGINLGRIDIQCNLRAKPERVCAGAGRECERWRIRGDVEASAVITISSNILVVGTNCAPYEPGSFRPRLPENIARTLEHEKLHCVVFAEFVNRYKQRIMDSPLFATKAECVAAIGSLITDFQNDGKELRRAMASHCPHFHGMLKPPIIRPCGEEQYGERYKCY